MGEARKRLVEIEESEYERMENAKPSAKFNAPENVEYRERMSREGMAAARDLLDFIRGGKKDEDNRGRARKQPAIIGVRG